TDERAKAGVEAAHLLVVRGDHDVDIRRPIRLLLAPSLAPRLAKHPIGEERLQQEVRHDDDAVEEEDGVQRSTQQLAPEGRHDATLAATGADATATSARVNCLLSS